MYEMAAHRPAFKAFVSTPSSVLAEVVILSNEMAQLLLD